MAGQEPGELPADNGEQHGGGTKRTRRRIVGLLLLAFAVAAPTAGWLWIRHLLDGPAAPGDFEATVVIARGASYGKITAELRKVGLLPHPFVFDYLAWRRADANRFRPGRYALRSSMSARQIYQTLLGGAPIVVTVPEGWTLERIDARLGEHEGLLGKRGAFLRAATDPAFLASHNVPTSSAEGYVLAETYHFDPGERNVLAKMVDAFERRYADEARTSPPQSLTWHQVLTLASMIEREARNDDEKSLIASVYYNRLRRGMKLDCDATVRYALSQWREPLTREDLKTSSPYNTYLNKGLPPGPICTIGHASLEAALSPAQSKFLYYCYKGDGGHYFSKTFAEHQRAVKKYLRKRLTPPPPQR